LDSLGHTYPDKFSLIMRDYDKKTYGTFGFAHATSDGTNYCMSHQEKVKFTDRAATLIRNHPSV
jgi:hypothetical protein